MRGEGGGREGGREGRARAPMAMLGVTEAQGRGRLHMHTLTHDMWGMIFAYLSTTSVVARLGAVAQRGARGARRARCKVECRLCLSRAAHSALCTSRCASVRFSRLFLSRVAHFAFSSSRWASVSFSSQASCHFFL